MVLGVILKIILVEGAGRYTLATGKTIFEGWKSLGGWTTWYFGPYILSGALCTAPRPCLRRRGRWRRCFPAWT